MNTFPATNAKHCTVSAAKGKLTLSQPDPIQHNTARAKCGVLKSLKLTSAMD